MDKKKYAQLVKKSLPKSEAIICIIKAFVVGGGICVFAQFFFAFLTSYDIKPDEAYGYTTMFMIFVGSTLTGVGIYDKLGQFAGAGSLVPVTGFANSVVSPAMEFKKEGLIFGTSAKMFAIAGPVLVYGFNSSVIIGLIYYISLVLG